MSGGRRLASHLKHNRAISPFRVQAIVTLDHLLCTMHKQNPHLYTSPAHTTNLICMYVYLTHAHTHAHAHTHTHHSPTHPQWILIQVRWFSLNHLDGHDPQGPDVDLRTVLLSGDHFGGHPVRGTHHCGPLGLLWGNLGTEPKISWRGGGRGGKEGRREGRERGEEGGREVRGGKRDREGGERRQKGEEISRDGKEGRD